MEVKRRTDLSLVQWLNLDSEQIRTQALCELRLLSKHDPDSRAYISEAGTIHLLLHLLYSSSSAAQENAIATLLNLSISDREPLMATPGLLDALSHLLRHPSFAASAQNASATLYSLLVIQDYRPIIGTKPQIVSTLVDLLRSHSSPTRSIKDALKALFGIALYPLNRPRIVDLGAVPALFSLALKDRSIGIMEDACIPVLVAEPERENYGGWLKTSFASFWKRQSINSTDHLNFVCFQEEFGLVFLIFDASVGRSRSDNEEEEDRSSVPGFCISSRFEFGSGQPDSLRSP